MLCDLGSAGKTESSGSPTSWPGSSPKPSSSTRKMGKKASSTARSSPKRDGRGACEPSVFQGALDRWNRPFGQDPQPNPLLLGTARLHSRALPWPPGHRPTPAHSQNPPQSPVDGAFPRPKIDTAENRKSKENRRRPWKTIRSHPLQIKGTPTFSKNC